MTISHNLPHPARLVFPSDHTSYGFLAAYFRVPLLSKAELQRQLDQPRRLGRQNVIKGWRADVTVRKAEIRMVEDVEELRAELKFL